MLKALIKELFAVTELHQEYHDTDAHFVVDSVKDGNELTIKVKLLKNKDKEDFENWLQKVDDDIFSNVLDELKREGLADLEQMYNSKDYKTVISKVKSKTRELAERRIKELQKFLN